MRSGSWLRAIGLGLAVLFIAAFTGVGSVAAHQRGDASLPTDNDGWHELGAEFISPDQSPTSTISGDTYVLPASGTEVVVADGVTADDPAGSDFEDQVLLTIPTGIGAVAVIPGLGYPVTIMESYVEGFAESLDNAEEINVEEDRSSASGLYKIDMSGASILLFITVDAVTSPGNFIIQVAVSGTGEIDDAIVVLRDNVLVDGIPMFANVDEQSMQDLADGHLDN